MSSHTAAIVFFVAAAFFGSIVSFSDAAYAHDGYKAEGPELVPQPSSSVVRTAHGRTPRRTVSRGALTLISITAASIVSLYVILSCFRSIMKNVDGRGRRLAVGGKDACSGPSTKGKKPLDSASFHLGLAQMSLSSLAIHMKVRIPAIEPCRIREALKLAQNLLDRATLDDKELRALTSVLFSLLSSRPRITLVTAEEVRSLRGQLEELARRSTLHSRVAALVADATQLARNVEALKYEGDLKNLMRLVQHIHELVQKGHLKDDRDVDLNHRFERLEQDISALLRDSSRGMVEYRIRVRADHIDAALSCGEVKSRLDLKAELRELITDLRLLQEVRPPAPLPFPTKEIKLIVEELEPLVEKIRSAGFESKSKKAKSVVDRARAFLEAGSASGAEIEKLACDLRELLLDRHLRTTYDETRTTTSATSEEPTSKAIAGPVSHVRVFLDSIEKSLRSSILFSTTLGRTLWESMGDPRSDKKSPAASRAPPASPPTLATSRQLSWSVADLRSIFEGDPESERQAAGFRTGRSWRDKKPLREDRLDPTPSTTSPISSTQKYMSRSVTDLRSIFQKDEETSAIDRKLLTEAPTPAPTSPIYSTQEYMYRSVTDLRSLFERDEKTSKTATQVSSGPGTRADRKAPTPPPASSSLTYGESSQSVAGRRSLFEKEGGKPTKAAPSGSNSERRDAGHPTADRGDPRARDREPRAHTPDQGTDRGASGPASGSGARASDSTAGSSSPSLLPSVKSLRKRFQP